MGINCRQMLNIQNKLFALIVLGGINSDVIKSNGDFFGI